MRDCTVSSGDCREYKITIDGETTIQNRMFNRADMSFWGFSASDVEPPVGQLLKFWDSSGEPYFEPMCPAGIVEHKSCNCVDRDRRVWHPVMPTVAP